MQQAWERDGFLVIDNFADTAACRSLIDRFHAIVDAYDESEDITVFETHRQSHAAARYFRTSGDKVRLFFEDDALDEKGHLTMERRKAVNKMGHAMHDLDPVFSAFSRQPRLARLTSDLGIRDPGLVQSMLIVKPPRIGGQVACHQDSSFLYTEPQTCVGFWFALEDATIENGCLRAVPGAHLAPLMERFHYDDLGDLTLNRIGPKLWNDDDAVPLEAPAGTLVVLHGNLPHMSGANRSDRSRLAYSMHVIDRRAKWAADNWLVRGPDMPLRGFA